MNRLELEEMLEQLKAVGLTPDMVIMERTSVEDKELKDPEEVLGEYVGNEETLRTIEVSKVDFNKACDTVIYNTEDLDFVDIITLARFTAAVRYLLFDKKDAEDCEKSLRLTQSDFHEACDDVWEVWRDSKNRTREQKLATAEFVKMLNNRIFKDGKTEKEEN